MGAYKDEHFIHSIKEATDGLLGAVKETISG